jgi:hypothetical protein
MNTTTLAVKLDQISVEDRVAVIKAFQILERAATNPLTEHEKAAVDAAKELLLQTDVSVKIAS